MLPSNGLNTVIGRKNHLDQLVKDQIKKTLIRVEVGDVNGLFRLQDVMGNGNCLYNAAVLSPHIRFTCPLEFRDHLFKAIDEKGQLSQYVYYEVAQETDEFESWIQKMRKPGVWAGTTIALFISWIFNVNIIIVTNGERGFLINDFCKYNWLEHRPATNTPYPNIYLYYHRYNAPFSPSNICDHYGYMFPLSCSRSFNWSERGFSVYTNYSSNPSNNDDTVNRVTDLTIQSPLLQNNTSIKKSSDSKGKKRKNQSDEKEKKSPRKKKDKAAVQQARLMQFWGKMSVNKDKVSELNAERKSVDDLDRELECAMCIEGLISSIEQKDNRETKNTVNYFLKGRTELDWNSRSVIIYFYFHNFLGKKDLYRTAGLFRVNPRTLEGWITKMDMKSKWTSMVKELKFDDVLRSIPDANLRARLQRVPINQKMKDMDLCLNGNGLPLKIFTNNSQCSKSHQGILAFANANKGLYVKRRTKRVKNQVSTIKHLPVQEFVSQIVNERWNMGLAMTTDELKRILMVEAKKNNWSDWSDIYAQSNIMSKKKLYIFLHRAIKKVGFSVRKSTVSQKIPEDWRRLAEVGAKRIRDSFIENKVDVVLAADETYIRFNETKGLVICPTGEKRVGSATQVDDKAGCTVLPTMDMTSSRLLPPLVIFTGVFGATLMKKWQQYTTSLVMFTEKHWMTSQTFILYISWLMDMYKGKRIGLIVDYAPQHCSAEFFKWFKNLNDEAKHGTKIFIENVDKGLTSVYQPGDIAINKPLKDKIREAYHYHVTSISRNNFKPGQQIKISRENLLTFIEDACESINNDQKGTKSIYKSFRMCGLNPWDSNLSFFKSHLDSLEENKLYATLLKNNLALEL